MLENRQRKNSAKTKNVLKALVEMNPISSSKLKFNENKIKEIISSIKINNKNHNRNSRYSLEKSKSSIKNEKSQEVDFKKLILNDKIKLNLLEEKIKQQKILNQKKLQEIQDLKKTNTELKNTLSEKDKAISDLEKNISKYKNLNQELDIKINILNNENSGEELNLDDPIDREESLNYLLNMAMELRNQEYPIVDNMTYEELLALEEKIGNVSTGLTDEQIKLLKHEKFIKYKYLEDKCIICQFDFKELENVVVLPCKHCFHFACLKPWVQKQNNCPMCKTCVIKKDVIINNNNNDGEGV